MRRVSKGDWLLSILPDNEVSELSIFALVLDTRKTFTKVARWQAFGRVKLSDASLPTAFIKRYYQKIGELSVSSEMIDRIHKMLVTVPTDDLDKRRSLIFNYDKALYNSNPEKKSLEAILAERDIKSRQESFEVAILRCFENSNPENIEIRTFLEGLLREVEKVYADNDYSIYRNIENKVEDVVKKK